MTVTSRDCNTQAGHQVWCGEEGLPHEALPHEAFQTGFIIVCGLGLKDNTLDFGLELDFPSRETVAFRVVAARLMRTILLFI